ncbi:MAG TPA: hypothetical protein VM408_05090 [Methylomirabilota bacterium]|nr:hypothetical protein [Methylomirabilota bacterium]
MNPILAIVALAIVGGAVVGVAARDTRTVLLALVVTLAASPLLADPVSTPLGLAARLVGAILATYLLWVVARDRGDTNRLPSPTEGSRIGWPAEILVAASAAVVGFAAHGLGAPAGGPPLASAAGFAVAAVALTPVVTGRDVVRVGSGLLLLIDAALLVRAALGGTPGDVEQLVTATMVIVLAGSLAALAAAARADGTAGYTFADPARVRVRREPDAHPLDQL